MDKKLPAIYRSEGTKNKVNKEVYYSFLEPKEERSKIEQNKTTSKEKHSIEQTLDEIFHRHGYSFNVPVLIRLPGKEIHTFLAARNNSNLLTLDDEIIPIASILDIQIKKS